jgi:sarcosine oxidase subunit gamma
MQTWPLSQDGSASDVRALLSASTDLRVSDLTALPRFGLKGPGAAEWFAMQGFDLPQVNRTAQQKGMTILRLGSRDIMVLADPESPGHLTDLVSRWQAAPQGHSSWRDEAWAWLRLTGPAAADILSRLTAFDIRDTTLAVDAIAQTRVAHMDMVMLRNDAGFDLMFDIASTAQVLHDIDIARKARERA